MKLLVIGDVHAVTSELDDCQALMNMIEEIITAPRPVAEHFQGVVFTGDLFHNHGIVHLDVWDWWAKAFDKLCKIMFEKAIPNLIILDGNHDRSGSGVSALSLLSGVFGRWSHCGLNIMVARNSITPSLTYGQDTTTFIGYQKDEKEFVELCNEKRFVKGEVIFCHQTFRDAKLIEGFYSKDGIDLDLLNCESIVSGHIHSTQNVKKCLYVGSPRWRTLHDLNEEKYLWEMDIEGNRVAGTKTYDTSKFCKKMIQVYDVESEPLDLDEVLARNATTYVVVKGSQGWVKSRLLYWNGSGVRLSSIVECDTIRVSESSGIKNALSQYIEEYEPQYGTEKEVLVKKITETIEL